MSNKMTKELTIKKNPGPSQKTLSKLTRLVSMFTSNYLSEDTKSGYERDIRYFLKFCYDRGYHFNHPSEIKSSIFQEYRDYMLKKKKYAGATVLRKMVAVRSLLTWCLQEGLIERNPLLNVRLPKVSQISSTLDCTDEEVRRVLCLPNLKKASGSLHFLTLTLLFYLGLRKKEIRFIKLKDIYPKDKYTVLKITGKGDKIREVPLTPFLLSAIEKYIGLSGRKFNPESYLLQSTRKELLSKERPLHQATIDWIVKNYVKKAGVEKRISPHSCRATTIGNLLDQKVPIREVAVLVGHESILTTSRYDKRKKSLEKSAAWSVRY